VADRSDMLKAGQHLQQLVEATKQKQQAASLPERDNRLAHYFALFGALRLLLGYLATSGAKSDGIFLLGDPDFLRR